MIPFGKLQYRAPEKPQPEPDTSHRKPYLTMPEHGFCKYIVCDGASLDEKLCCGHPQMPGSSLCTHHHQRCYKPWTPLDMKMKAA